MEANHKRGQGSSRIVAPEDEAKIRNNYDAPHYDFANLL
jgi:hypothetical protein